MRRFSTMLKKPRNYYLDIMEGILSAVIKILKQSRTPLSHKYYADNIYYSNKKQVYK